MVILAIILSGLSLLMSILLLVRLRFPGGFYLLIIKTLATALSPVWAALGLIGAILGIISGMYWAIPMGFLGVAMMALYIWRCTRDHQGLEEAFGVDWSDKIPQEQEQRMIQQRWSWFLKLKGQNPHFWDRNVSFGMIPDTNRNLLCDIWRPAKDNASGLGLIYLHGGAWYYMDKDNFTRPFFRHLVSQGHTVMDVAYRLCPETDIYGMIEDVKRAIAWMKIHAFRYGVDPDRIVLGGASSGGHLALLAGYAPQHLELTPMDLKEADLYVCGVVSFYGPTDLLALYRHTNQERLANKPTVKIDPESVKGMGPRDWRMDILLDGWPQKAQSSYRVASPITHVHPYCPPTLLIQGEKDLISPAESTREMYTKLVEAGIPAINIIYPWTDHAFDVMLPQISPPAQSALYDVDRFLAILLNRD